MTVYIQTSTEPVYTFGLNLTAGWKGFDLSLMFNGATKVARLFDSHEVYVPSPVMPVTRQASGRMPGLKPTRMLPCRVSLQIQTLRAVHVAHVYFLVAEYELSAFEEPSVRLYLAEEPAEQLGC